MTNNQTRENKKYKLFLINGKHRYYHYADQSGFHLLGKKTSTSPLALPLIASLTPSNYDIRIIDEQICSIPQDVMPDIVGITTLLTTFTRVYEIADWYRSKGVKVVLGGTYATYMIEEGLKHADCIIKGEAEGAWEKCLEDFEKGQLKETYEAPVKTEFKKSPIPRWDLIDSSKVMSFGVQTTRGCPYKCNFCLVSKMFGHKVRFREIDDVITEIKSLPSKRVFFVDDNLTINKKYAKKLMKELKSLEISWICQSSIDVANDEELLQDMVEAGCAYILIGFESINPESLSEAKKNQNSVEEYEIAIKKINAVGIHIFASFVVGFDNDSLKEFDNIYNFANKNNLLYVLLGILECSPGMELYNQIEKEGRWINTPSDYRGGIFPVIHYMNMSQTDLYKKYITTLDKFYSFDTILQRAIRLFSQGEFIEEEKSKDIRARDKFRITLKLASKYLFSSNKLKRKLFIKLFLLIPKKKIAPDKAVIFLMSMEGYVRQIQQYKDDIEVNLDYIRSVDKGAWKDQPVQQ